MATGTDSTDLSERAQRDLDLSTLVIAALASVVAAVVTSKLWASGTLVSTAMTPVIVALVKEYAKRPVRKIGQVAKAPLVAVRTQPYRIPAPFESVPPDARRGRVLEADRPDPDEYEPLETVVPPGEGAATETPYRVYRKRSRTRRWWVVGLVTGLVAFVVAAAVITIPELVGGGSVAGSGRTTLFSGHRSTSKPNSDKTRTTTTPASTSGTSSSPSTSTTPSSSSSDSESSSGSSSSSTPQSTTTTPAPTATTPSTGSGGATPPPTTSTPSSSGSSTSGGG